MGGKTIIVTGASRGKQRHILLKTRLLTSYVF